MLNPRSYHRNRIVPHMAIKEPEAIAVGGKGLQAGAIGLVGNVVIGLAAVAPADSLAATLPGAPEIESLVADDLTLESALEKLNWNDTDVLVVGSSRFAAPRRIFLGSTAARILAGTDAPVIVVPRDDA
jgi:nucleotide-binding universal stress UspA family protein